MLVLKSIHIYMTSDNVYRMSFNRALKTLLYRNLSKPKYISVISILQLAA